MSAIKYYEHISEVLSNIRTTQESKIQSAGEKLATAITAGKRAYLYGSGHSVIPVMDIFPRYGSYVGFGWNAKKATPKCFCKATRWSRAT